MDREHRIVSAVVSSKDAWDSVSLLADPEDFSETGWLVFQQAEEYYRNDPDARSMDRDFLLDSLVHKYPRFTERFRTVVAGLDDVSVPNVLQEFRELKMEAAASHLAEAIMAGDRQEQDKYFEKYSFYRDYTVEKEEEEIFVGTDIDEILEGYQPDNLIPIEPAILNDKFDGGVIPGTQIAVYAPTEVGKSLFAINMACGMLEQGRTVLYCGNEDPAKAMLLRFYSRLTGMTKKEMMKSPQTAKEVAFERGYGNLVFYEMSPGTVHDIKRQVEKFKPSILFVDQMANMGTSSNFTKTEKNEFLSVKLRELAKKYNLVNVILHQASEEAYGNLYVQKNDMYYSNVGVQGQMDIMLGIGMDPSYEQQGRRMICITKNKLSGNHDAVPVQIDPFTSRID